MKAATRSGSTAFHVWPPTFRLEPTTTLRIERHLRRDPKEKIDIRGRVRGDTEVSQHARQDVSMNLSERPERRQLRRLGVEVTPHPPDVFDADRQGVISHDASRDRHQVLVSQYIAGARRLLLGLGIRSWNRVAGPITGDESAAPGARFQSRVAHAFDPRVVTGLVAPRLPQRHGLFSVHLSSFPGLACRQSEDAFGIRAQEACRIAASRPRRGVDIDVGMTPRGTSPNAS